MIFRILKLIRVSFKEYLQEHNNGIAILSLLYAVFASIFSISDFIKANFNLSFILLVIILIIIGIHYYQWYKNNFKKVSIDIKALLIIEGRDDNQLSIDISKLIIPSEDLMFLTLIVEFGDFIKQELLNKTYTLLIKKPEDLEIKFKNNIKSDPLIIDDGFNSSFYCINLKYKNNTVDKLLFELRTDKTTHGDFLIYFLNEDETKFIKTIEGADRVNMQYNALSERNKMELTKHFEKISSKKAHIIKETVYSKDIEISRGDCIVINKKY